jgi:hypothetical protein
VTVYHLFGEAFGFFVIVADDSNALLETAVDADEISVIAGHHALAFSPGERSHWLICAPDVGRLP